MAFISELIGRPVTDVDGRRIGTLVDLVARPLTGVQHPVVTAVLARTKSGIRAIPFVELAVLLSAAIPLRRTLAQVVSYEFDEGDIRLARDVLDQQILDTEGARVVRVNDIELLRVNSHVVVANVDVGLLGILRRLGLENLGRGVARRFHRDLQGGTISWDFVELLLHDQPMRLRIPSRKLAELHPSDIAEIISDLNRAEHAGLLQQLELSQLADTLEEVEPEFQANLLEHFPDEKAADVLEEMAPDEATDLLAELPQERRQSLLRLMESDEAAEVRELLKYEEDTAGGLMTTEYLAVPSTLNAAQSIEYLRKAGEEAELLYYVYVVDTAGVLEGVFSLSDLILAAPETPISEFMHKRVVSVDLDTPQDDVAQVVAKYSLIAVPVVDPEHRLRGIVTADDALDKIIPTTWKKRLPHFFGATK
ncbi:MAG TPA: CBS domain-containing protein [Anaerolineales bacterium]|nr:CBS domain-containing protein [Anaerolineales bacterium]